MILKKSLTQIKNIKFDLIFFINLSFCMLPLAYILGNLLINLNSLILCCLGILYLKNKLFYFKPDFLFKIIILFFFLVFFSTSINIKSINSEGFEIISYDNFVKSITFFRHLILLIIIYLLNSYNAINFKYFFYTAAFFSIIVSLDVIHQYIFGYDILGMESNYLKTRRNQGFFGEDRQIAGGFIARFSFFSIFLIFYLTNKKKWTNLFITSAAIYIVGLGILLAGNRMPMLLFLLGLFLIFIFVSKLRKATIIGFTIFFVTFIGIFSNDEVLRHNYGEFYLRIKNILFFDSAKNVEHKTSNNTAVNLKKDDMNLNKGEKEFLYNELIYIPFTHKNLFLTAVDTWKLNKILGNGIKSFRKDCKKIIKTRFRYKIDHYKLARRNRGCSNHPHNYYFEVLTETGFIGLCLLVSFFMILLKFSFKFCSSYKNKINEDHLILVAALISLIVELFPIRSSGSFFSTQNATYIIFILSIIMSYKRSHIS